MRSTTVLMIAVALSVLGVVGICTLADGPCRWAALGVQIVGSNFLVPVAVLLAGAEARRL